MTSQALRAPFQALGVLNPQRFAQNGGFGNHRLRILGKLGFPSPSEYSVFSFSKTEYSGGAHKNHCLPHKNHYIL